MPRAQGIYVELPAVENDMTVVDIAHRVQRLKSQFKAKFDAKKMKQDDYYTNVKKSLSKTLSDVNPEAASPKTV